MKTSPVKIGCLVALAAAIGSVTACKSPGGSEAGSSEITISGAGSTFVYPVMTRWAEAYRQAHPGVQINYQSIGSGGGIQQVKQGTVDFGASDATLSDAQLSTMKAMIQIPESAGPVCITYNLPELKAPLQLSGETLAAIYLGKVTSWNDQTVKRDNPNVDLPSTRIVVTHRAEGSGTTAIFTAYLAAVSTEWQQKIGSGTAVGWPAGVGGKGSEGVTGLLRQSPGAIGYVELTYAQQNNLPVAAVRNLAGTFVTPSAASTTAAIDAFQAQLARNMRLPIVNPPGSAADAYPIAGLTFLILPTDGPGKDKRAALKSFVQYVIGDGQAVAGTLAYAPLPEALKKYDVDALSGMTADGHLLP